MSENLTHEFDFTTDTATLVVFDIANLRHRRTSKADWWSVPSAELTEVNAGNAIFVGLGFDGTFHVSLHFGKLDRTYPFAVMAHMSVQSGRVFVGPGEMVTNDGLEPDLTAGGVFVEVTPGAYTCYVMRSEVEKRTLILWLEQATGATNNVQSSLQLP